MPGSPKKRARRLAASLTDWESVKDGHWANTHGDTIRVVDPRGGFKLYARRDVGSKRPTWYTKLPEAKKGEAHAGGIHGTGKSDHVAQHSDGREGDGRRLGDVRHPILPREVESPGRHRPPTVDAGPNGVATPFASAKVEKDQPHPGSTGWVSVSRPLGTWGEPFPAL